MLSIKIPSWSSILASTASKDFEPRKAIATSQELVVPWEENIFPLKLSHQCLPFSTVERVSCKKQKTKK